MQASIITHGCDVYVRYTMLKLFTEYETTIRPLQYNPAIAVAVHSIAILARYIQNMLGFDCFMVRPSRTYSFLSEMRTMKRRKITEKDLACRGLLSSPLLSDTSTSMSLLLLVFFIHWPPEQ